MIIPVFFILIIRFIPIPFKTIAKETKNIVLIYLDHFHFYCRNIHNAHSEVALSVGTEVSRFFLGKFNGWLQLAKCH